MSEKQINEAVPKKMKPPTSPKPKASATPMTLLDTQLQVAFDPKNARQDIPTGMPARPVTNQSAGDEQGE